MGWIGNGKNPANCNGRDLENGLLRHFEHPGFADDGHFDFAGVIELLLDGPGNFTADPYGIGIGGLIGSHNNADFPTRLNRIGVFHFRETAGNRF